MRHFAIALLLVLFSATGWSKGRTVVWEHPAAQENRLIDAYYGTGLEVTRVELAPDETRLMLRISSRRNRWVKFAAGTHLVSEGQTYALRRLEGMETDRETFLDEKEYADLTFHFDPLPKGTRRFDFTEGDDEGSFRILGIEDAGTRAQRLFPSLWRNECTGDWELALYDDFAIFDCLCWNYKHRQQHGDRCDIVLEREGREVSVRVGKNKGGRRVISIGSASDTYSPVTSVCLPDYPSRDTVTSFPDTDYTPATATLAGWVKDVPHKMREQGEVCQIIRRDLFTGEPQDFTGELDSLGRFSISVPLLGPTEVYFYCGPIYFSMLLEPGRTYFLLYDFGEGHKLMMGADSRVQNELLAAPVRFLTTKPASEMDEAATMNYLEEMKRDKQRLFSLLDETRIERPNISDRYVRYLACNYNTTEGGALLQARFKMADWRIPEDYMHYITLQDWQQRIQPYTLCADFPYFRRDYIDQLVHNRFYKPTGQKGAYIVMTQELLAPVLRCYRDAGKLALTDDELSLVDYYGKNCRNRLDSTLMKSLKVMGREDVRQILPRASALMTAHEALGVLDTANCDQALRDITLTHLLLEKLDQDRVPLDEATIQFFDGNVRMQAARDALHARQEQYLALSRKDISVSESLRRADDVAGMSDGEQLLRKLTEPYRGKIILLDVWGTWCAPCKDALSHSKEEYERLKDYDLVYLYLCNGSSDESWQAVIKQYDVVGENVVHYNLPQAQQSAIEEFLGVHAFPTYKLIDREGNVLDVNADPRGLDGLVRVLDQMK